ncbi:hypothetical protein GCM10008986_19940 [Salinibacillus aidingensis]|uniref:Uncharacterized protein n=2 Tax=Salinibacillus aidingensis TaxID=237684 RepID=A0ABP3L568_9BACI
MLSWMIRIGLLVISFVSLLFYPAKALHKYFPVSLFTSGLVLIMCSLSFRYKFWMVSGSIFKRLANDLTFVFGPFFAGTLWTFHLTFGKFWRYVTVNAALSIGVSFLVNPLLQRYNVYKFVNFNSAYLFLTYMGYALVIYPYQLLIKDRKKKA